MACSQFLGAKFKVVEEKFSATRLSSSSVMLLLFLSLSNLVFRDFSNSSIWQSHFRGKPPRSQHTGIFCQVTLSGAGGKLVHHWAANRGNSYGRELKWNRNFVFWYSPRKPEKFPPVWNHSRFRKSASDGSLSKEIFPIGEEFRIGTAILLGFVKLFRLQPLLFFLHRQESSTTWATYHLQQIISNFKLIQGRKVVSPC